MQSSKEKIDELSANLANKLDVYDQILGKQKYLTGEVIYPSTARGLDAHSLTIEHHLGRSLPRSLWSIA